LDQLQETPPDARRRLRLPGVAALRQLGVRRLQLLPLHVRRGASKPSQRLLGARRLPRWRRTQRP
jgi:hypothetical protein